MKYEVRSKKTKPCQHYFSRDRDRCRDRNRMQRIRMRKPLSALIATITPRLQRSGFGASTILGCCPRLLKRRTFGAHTDNIPSFRKFTAPTARLYYSLGQPSSQSYAVSRRPRYLNNEYTRTSAEGATLLPYARFIPCMLKQPLPGR